MNITSPHCQQSQRIWHSGPSPVSCAENSYRTTKTGDESARWEAGITSAAPWMPGAAVAVWPGCWTMLYLVCVTGSLPGCAETDYPVWTYVTLDTHQSSLFSVVWFQTSLDGAYLSVVVCVCYLQNSSDNEHRLVCDLWILCPSVQSVPQLPAGFSSCWPPEDAPGVGPLQVQEHQHVLEETGGWRVMEITFLNIYL